MTVNDLLARLDGVREAGTRKWMARCPAHEDDTPSLSIAEGGGGTVLVKCHAGCATEDVLAARGLTLGDLFSDTPARNGAGHAIAATYDYRDAAGVMRYQVVRFTPKDFRQRQPDGHGGWVWNLQGVEKVLYRLPEVLAEAGRGGEVFVCEGEKDVDRLAALGLVATCNSGGAGTWLRHFADAFAGAQGAVLFPDNDDPGREHMQTVARSLHGIVSDIRVVTLPDVPEKGDVSDWLDAGGTIEALRALLADTPPWQPLSLLASAPPARTPSAASPEPATRKLPPPMGPRELRRLVAAEPAESWLVRGLVPTDANVLLAAYPKSGKTMLIEELALALASGTPFLQRFPVAERRRVGVVLMEDRKRSTLARLERMCLGRGITLDDLDGWLYVWQRPPLSLGDATAGELGDFARDLDLDLLAVDSWQYVGSGNSDRADEVGPQLAALSAARSKRPGLSVLLVHHARKDARGDDPAAQRLTDLIRNSSAFGAWYDLALHLARTNENTPITVRTEARDAPPLAPFAVVLEDEEPGDPGAGVMPSGWLRLRAVEGDPVQLEEQEQAERLIPQIREYLAQCPERTASSKLELRNAVRASPNTILTALEMMTRTGEVLVTSGPRNAQRITLREEGKT